AGTGAGSYTIRAVYNATTNLTASTDTTHTLVVAPATTTTVSTAAAATFSVSGQSVSLSATVTSGAGVVNRRARSLPAPPAAPGRDGHRHGDDLGRRSRWSGECDVRPAGGGRGGNLHDPGGLHRDE